MADELSRRNTAAFEQGLKEANSQLSSQQARIVSLESTIVTLLERITTLEAMIMAYKVKTMGHGPTEK